MIEIGTNENVYLSVTEFKANDKGVKSLVIGFSEIGTENKTNDNDILALLNEGSDASGSKTSTNVVLFAPNREYNADSNEKSPIEYKKGDVRPGEDILADFLDFKNVLAHIVKRFITNENSFKFDILAGIQVTGTSPKEIAALFQKEEVIAKAYANLSTQFIALLANYTGKQEFPSRLLLVRTSVAKHFGTLRRKFINNNPFFESMAVEIPKSKLYTKQIKGTTGIHEPVVVDGVNYVPAFNEYEISKGLDSGARVVEDDEDAENSAAGMGAPSTLGLGLGGGSGMFNAGAGTGTAPAGLGGLGI